MDKLKEFLSEWDKVMHILVSAVCFMFFTALGVATVKNFWIGILIGVSSAALIGFAKETVDADKNGYFNWKDIIADASGIIVMLIPLIIIGICNG